MSLGTDEAHLWLVEPDAIRDPALLEKYRSLLSPDEVQKCGRYRFEKDQHSCLVTRALVRTVLSRYVDVPPETWRFETNEYGRPEITEPDEGKFLKFNLSHTKGLIACIVTRWRDVGVDVEDRERSGELIKVADRFFSPHEVDALHAQPESEQNDRFFSYWTLKESYIKARGMGLSIPLAHFSFELDVEPQRGIRIGFAPELEDDPDSWQFTAFSFGRNHAVAAAVRRGRGKKDVTIVLRQTVPLLHDI